MGEAKRRKKLDPTFGNIKNVSKVKKQKISKLFKNFRVWKDDIFKNHFEDVQNALNTLDNLTEEEIFLIVYIIKIMFQSKPLIVHEPLLNDLIAYIDENYQDFQNLVNKENCRDEIDYFFNFNKAMAEMGRKMRDKSVN